MFITFSGGNGEGISFVDIAQFALKPLKTIKKSYNRPKNFLKRKHRKMIYFPCCRIWSIYSLIPKVTQFKKHIFLDINMRES